MTTRRKKYLRYDFFQTRSPHKVCVVKIYNKFYIISKQTPIEYAIDVQECKQVYKPYIILEKKYNKSLIIRKSSKRNGKKH